MKKHIITLFALVLASLAMQAYPVGQETARRLGQSFVMSTFEFTRQSSELSMVYTAFSERGEACYYVFNVGNTGFVIMSADDFTYRKSVKDRFIAEVLEMEISEIIDPEKLIKE